MTATVVMIDATHASLKNIPADAKKVALYLTGSPDIRSTAADRARFAHVVVTIDQSADGTMFAEGLADVLDVETGAASDAAAATDADRRQKAVTAVKARQAGGFDSTIYVAQAHLADLKAKLNAEPGLKMNKVAFWVADWNLSEAEARDKLGNDVVAIQWASPTTNPDTLVPGSTLTLAEANADLSVTLDSWYPVPAAKPKPKAATGRTVRKAMRRTATAAKTTAKKEPVMTSAGFLSVLTALLAALQKGKGLHLTPTEVKWVLDALVALGGSWVTAAAKPRAVAAATTVLGTGATALATTVLHVNPTSLAAVVPALALGVAHISRANLTPVANAAATAIADASTAAAGTTGAST